MVPSTSALGSDSNAVTDAKIGAFFQPLIPGSLKLEKIRYHYKYDAIKSYFTWCLSASVILNIYLKQHFLCIFLDSYINFGTELINFINKKVLVKNMFILTVDNFWYFYLKCVQILDDGKNHYQSLGKILICKRYLYYSHSNKWIVTTIFKVKLLKLNIFLHFPGP